MANDKKKILIVEEDLFLANIYRVKLEQEGYHVLVASGGQQGAEACKEFKPDMVMSEVLLVDLDGFALQETVRADGFDGQFIYLTKLGEKEDVDRGLKLGAKAYFIKTQVTFREVIERIKELFAIAV